MNKVVAAALALPVLAFAGDYLSLRLRIPNREPFGSVQVQRMFEVAMKNHTTEYMPEEPRPQACVRSLFPHFGDAPCWYLVRHPRQIVKLGSNPDDVWRRIP
jgi:hypothetical protein